MKLKTDGRWSNAYIRKLDREKYLALAVITVIALMGFCGLYFHIGEADYPDMISNILYPLSSFIGATLAFFTAYRMQHRPVQASVQQQRAWRLVGLGLVANCLGSLYFTYLDRSGQTILVPSLSDLGFTLFYPLIFVGLLLMPNAQRFRLRMALDALIATLGILGVSWFFFINRVFNAQVEARVPVPELVTVVSYPFWDMLLILAIMLLIFRRTDSHFSLSLVIFGAGILANIWADTGYAYTVAVGSYSAINFFIDPFWYLGFLLVGLSGLFQYAALVRVAAHKEAAPTQQISGQLSTYTVGSNLWQTVQYTLIYLPLTILVALTLLGEYQEFAYHQKSSLFLTGLTALVGLLVAIRFLIASRENENLVAALARAHGEQEAVAAEQKKLYTELRVAHERLKELDKLKDQFMVTASHELRTPLTSIQGYLDLLVQYDDTLPAAQQKKFLLHAQHGCEELVLLLNNMMDASRLEIDAGIRPAHLQSVEIHKTLQSVVTLMEPQLAGEKRRVEMQVPLELSVQADPTRLRQVLLNLSMNAIKYSHQGTPIIYAARAVAGPDPCVLLSVIDHGKGIEPQDQGRLFQRFVRLERDLNSTVRGSGLGLYISRQLVEAMGGKIWVESSGVEGEGSCFHIELPACR